MRMLRSGLRLPWPVAARRRWGAAFAAIRLAVVASEVCRRWRHHSSWQRDKAVGRRSHGKWVVSHVDGGMSVRVPVAVGLVAGRCRPSHVASIVVRIEGAFHA